MGDKDWSFKFCDCCATPQYVVCFVCCPCWASCTLTLTIFALNPKEQAGLRCCLACFFPCICFPINRNKTRNFYKIKGNWCLDFLSHCFCHCCALIQEVREATKEIQKEIEKEVQGQEFQTQLAALNVQMQQLSNLNEPSNQPAQSQQMNQA